MSQRRWCIKEEYACDGTDIMDVCHEDKKGKTREDRGGKTAEGIVKGQRK